MQRQAMAAPGTVAAAEQADQAADGAAPSPAAAKKGAEKKAKKAATSKKAKVEAEGEAETVATDGMGLLQGWFVSLAGAGLETEWLSASQTVVICQAH